MSAVRSAAAPDQGPSNPDIAAFAGTFLFWAVALDERLEKLNGPAYSAGKEEDSGGRLFLALTLARNAVAHGSAICATAPGFTIPFTLPLSIPASKWRPLDELLSEWVDPWQTKSFEARKVRYAESLEGQTVTNCMPSVIRWLDRAADQVIEGQIEL